MEGKSSTAGLPSNMNPFLDGEEDENPPPAAGQPSFLAANSPTILFIEDLAT